MLKSRQATLLLVALGFGLAGVLAQRFANPPEPLMGAPGEVRVAEVWDARLPDLAGRIQALGQWQGKVLVLNFWAPWCPPCRKEIPDFIRLQERLGGAGLQFVGVALDDPDKVAAFVDETGINYPILLGAEEASGLSLAAGNRLGGLPYTVVFDKRGAPVATLTGGVTEARLDALVKPLLE
ncbi:MAG: TlpA disulfide reductase family protein [Pseudomonadota bacterium]